MIVVTAHLWPRGNASAAIELGMVTVSNQGPGANGDNYTAHVLTRPAPHIGCIGYEADVEVRDHARQNGFAPLLISVLAAAHGEDGNGFSIPPSRALARSVIHDMHDFEERLKGRR